MKASALLLASILAASATPAFAEACTCVANGRSFDQGETACLKLPTGLHYARCDKVLNNSSWKTLGESCPQFASHDRADASASAAMAEEPLESWPEGALFSPCLDRDLRTPG